jgi:hypothetical protein
MESLGSTELLWIENSIVRKSFTTANGPPVFREITDAVIGTTGHNSKNGDVDEVDGNKETE